MLAKALSCAVVGLDSALVEVEVDLSPGLPSFQIVGLPDTAVQEARERVRAAIKNSGGRFPGNRITVNLAPAAPKKVGRSYDLAIGVGVITAVGQLDPDVTASRLSLGELSFDGPFRAPHYTVSHAGLVGGGQLERFAGTRMTSSAEMGPKEVRQYCPVEPAAQALLKAAVQQHRSPDGCLAPGSRSCPAGDHSRQQGDDGELILEWGGGGAAGHSCAGPPYTTAPPYTPGPPYRDTTVQSAAANSLQRSALTARGVSPAPMHHQES